MTLAQILINLLLAFLAFFVIRWAASLVTPEAQDKDRIVNIVALIVGVVVFFANFAHYIIG